MEDGFEWFRGRGSQNKMLKRSKEMKHNFIFAKDEENNSKQYSSYCSGEEFMEIYRSLEKRNFYEITPDDSALFEYYDIDDISGFTNEEVFNKFEEFYIHEFLPEIKDESKTFFLVLESVPKKDVSLHIINKYRLCKTKNELKEMYKIMKRVLNKKENQEKYGKYLGTMNYGKVKGIDPNVISSYRLMRMIGSSKINKESILVPSIWHKQSNELKDNWIDFLITCYDNKQKKFTLNKLILENEKMFIKEKNTSKIKLVENQTIIEIVMDDDHREIIDKIIFNLSKERSEGYSSWISIIWKLRDIGANLNDVKNFSKKASNYDEEKTIEIYNKFNKSKIRGNSLDQLINLAYQDSKGKFEPLKTEKFGYKKLFNNDEGLSEICYFSMRDYVVITDESGKEGYVFDENNCLWKKQNKLAISRLIIKELKKTINYWKNKKIKEIENDESIQGQIKKLGIIEKSIEKTKTKNSIWEQLVPQLLDEKFEEKLNIKKNILPLQDCLNINLQTGEIIERTKEDYFSIEISVNYKKKYDKEKVELFMKKIFCGDMNLLKFFQVLGGYFLTGEITHRKLYVCHGKGLNGKTTLLENIMGRILGDFFTTVTADVLLKCDNRGKPNPEIANMIGKRLCVFSEPESDEDDEIKMNEGRVKLLTSGDIIRYREMYAKKQQGFKPLCKLAILCNKKPTFDYQDKAMTERLNFLPFNARFVKTREKSILVEQFIETYIDDIFSWLVDGSMEYYKNDIPNCSTVVENTLKCFEEGDTIGRFFNEVCEFPDYEGDKNFITGRQKLYESYKEYCKAKEIDSIDSTNAGKIFKQKLSDMGINKLLRLKDNTGDNYYYNIKVDLSKIKNESIIEIDFPEKIETIKENNNRDKKPKKLLHRKIKTQEINKVEIIYNTKSDPPF